MSSAASSRSAPQGREDPSSGPERALLLDFGGTLDSDGQHWSTQFAQAFTDVQLSVERGALDRAFLAADGELRVLPGIAQLDLRSHVLAQARLMLARLDLSVDLGDAVAEAFVSRSVCHLDRSRRILERHRDRCLYGLVSNFTPNLPRIVEQSGLSHLVDTVVCSELEGVAKPDPALFRIALDRLGVAPGQAAMVGDSLASDIVPARGLGLTTCWIRGDMVFVADDARAAHHVVRSLSQAIECLEQDGFFG